MKFNIKNLNKEKYWVDEYVENGKDINFTDGLLPNLYSNYFKLFLPVGLENKNNIIEQITYKELAKKADVEFNNSFSFTDLIEKFGGLPSNFVILKEKDEIFIKVLIEILGTTENTVFEGYGDDIVPKEFEQPWTIEDKLEKLTEIFKQLNKGNYHDYNHFPNLMYPQNRGWCIATKIFQSGILVIGCDNFIAEKIRTQSVIDFVELAYHEEYFKFIKS